MISIYTGQLLKDIATNYQRLVDRFPDPGRPGSNGYGEHLGRLQLPHGRGQYYLCDHHQFLQHRLMPTSIRGTILCGGHLYITSLTAAAFMAYLMKTTRSSSTGEDSAFEYQGLPTSPWYSSTVPVRPFYPNYMDADMPS